MISFSITAIFNHFQIWIKLQYLFKHDKIALHRNLLCKKVIKSVWICHNYISLRIGLVFELTNE